MGPGGLRQEVTAGSGFAVKADVFHVAVASDATLDLPETRATATRARMLLEWESEWAPSPSARVRPRLELGGPLGRRERRGRLRLGVREAASRWRTSGWGRS